MITTVTGKLADKQPTAAVVTVGGMGLEIHIPLSTYEALPAVGDEATLHTHLHVREDVLKLFGFATMEEKTLFSTVISVSGIGPNLALSILSGSSVAEFAHAITTENLKAITGIPGIGKKTAQRMVVELKDKMAGMAVVAPGERIELPAGSRLADDAVAALMSLGMKDASAQNAVARVLNEDGDDLTVQTLIRKALKYA